MREQAIPDGVVGAIRRARGDGGHGARVPDQPGEQVARAGLHDEPAAREDEADLCGARRDADRHGQRHGDADADGGAVQRGDGGLAAALDGEDDAPAAGEGRGLVMAWIVSSRRFGV